MPLQGRTALHIAAERGLKGIVTTLILKQHNVGLQARDRKVQECAFQTGRTTHCCAVLGLPLLCILLCTFAESTLCMQTMSESMLQGWTPLHCAAFAGQCEAVALLLVWKAKINIRDHKVGLRLFAVTRIRFA